AEEAATEEPATEGSEEAATEEPAAEGTEEATTEEPATEGTEEAATEEAAAEGAEEAATEEATPEGFQHTTETTAEPEDESLLDASGDVVFYEAVTERFSFEPKGQADRPKAHENNAAFEDDGDVTERLDLSETEMLKAQAEFDEAKAEIEKASEGMSSEEIRKTEGIHFLDNGNIIFGRYDQGKGPESIEWIVLKQERGGKLLVISKYALDYLPYHEQSRGVSWETCSLREWLNKSFIRTAFTENEQAHLIEYHVPADRNPECETTVGQSTYDRVFLLSLKEAKKLLENDKKRQCQHTPYAKSHQQNPDERKMECWWWLRTAGNFIYNAAGVAADGSLVYRGRPVDDGDSAVRPAMWIKLK
ncbi:MAG: hypothetical protein J5825_08245, partial [Lachnospiraceae bacterium]|nr:hypothetical protein [Lachnospiraceae bacterium]